MRDTPSIKTYRYPAETCLLNDWAWLPVILVSLASGVYLLLQGDALAYALSILPLVIFPAAVLRSTRQTAAPNEVEIAGDSVRLNSRFAHREFALSDITRVEEGVITPLVRPCSGVARVHFIYAGKPTYFLIGPYMSGFSELVEFLVRGTRSR